MLMHIRNPTFEFIVDARKSQRNVHKSFQPYSIKRTDDTSGCVFIVMLVVITL